MNILDFKRKALGYTFREGAGGDVRDSYPSPSTNTTSKYITVAGGFRGDDSISIPNPTYVAPPDPEIARAKIAAALGVPVSSVVPQYGTMLGGRDDNTQVTDYDNITGYAVKQSDSHGVVFDNAGKQIGVYNPSNKGGGGFLGNFFAGLDSTLGLSNALTSVSNALADLDNDLNLSENAPAILAIAAAVVGAPYISQLISSSGATAAAAEVIGSGLVTAETAAIAASVPEILTAVVPDLIASTAATGAATVGGLAAGELGLAGGTALGAGNLGIAGLLGGTGAAATTGASLGAGSGLMDFGLGDILSTTAAPAIGQGAVLAPAATAGTGAMGAGLGGAATTAAGEIIGTGAAGSGFTFSGLLKNPGGALGNALGITDPTLAKLAGNTIIETAKNGGDIESAIKNTAISYGLNIAGSTVSTAVKDALKDIPQSELSDSVKAGITRGVTGAAVATLQGRDPMQALVGSASSTALNELVKQIPGYSDNTLSPEAKKIANDAVKAALTGKDITSATLNAALNEGVRAAAGYADTALGLGSSTATSSTPGAANPMSQDPAQRAGANVVATEKTNNGYDLSELTNAGLSESNLSEETVADILNSTGEVQPGLVTAALNTGVVSDAGPRGGNPLQNDTEDILIRNGLNNTGNLTDVNSWGGVTEVNTDLSDLPLTDVNSLGDITEINTDLSNLPLTDVNSWGDVAQVNTDLSDLPLTDVNPRGDVTEVNTDLSDLPLTDVNSWGDVAQVNTDLSDLPLTNVNSWGDVAQVNTDLSDLPLTDVNPRGDVTEVNTDLSDLPLTNINSPGSVTEVNTDLSDLPLTNVNSWGDVTQVNANGINGADGRDGATGERGERGVRGERGEAGISQTPEQIRAIVDAALAANPSLTEAQVTSAINAAIANIPAGISTADVSNAINTAIANIPAGISNADVTNIVTDATKDLATKTDVETAIANIQFPAGISRADVAEQITTALAANPNLTASDVAQSISEYMTANPGITAADVGSIVANATQGLATTGSVEALQADLTKAINDANSNNASAFDAIDQAIADLKAAGLTEQQVQTIVNTSAGNVTQAFRDALNEAVTGNNTALDALQTTLSESIAATETKLTEAIAANQAAGLTRDQATQKAIDDVAGQLGTTKADLLTQLGTTEAALTTKLNTGLAEVETKLTETEQRLSDAIQAAKDIGLEGDAALQAGIDSVAAELGIAKSELLTQLGKTENDLRDEFQTGLGVVTTDIAKTRTDLLDAIAANQADGLTRDEATQKAIDDLAGQLGTTKVDLLAQLGTTEAELGAQIAGVQTNLTNQLTAQGQQFMDALVAQGMDQATALQTAIDAQNEIITTGQTATQTALATLSAAQQQEVADRVAAGETTNAAIAAVQLAVDTGQAATQAALNALSTAQQQEVADRVAAGETTNAAIAAVQTAVTEGQTDTNRRIDDLMAQGLTQYEATQQAILELSTGFTDQLTAAELARQTDRDAAEAARQADIAAAAEQRLADQQAAATAAAEAETARQTEITNQKARETANLKTIQTGQLRGQMQSGLQGLIGGLQQQATQMAAPAQVETVKSTPGFDFGSPLNTGFFSGYESQKVSPKDKESLKIATGGYLDDLLEAIR